MTLCMTAVASGQRLPVKFPLGSQLCTTRKVQSFCNCRAVSYGPERP